VRSTLKAIADWVNGIFDASARPWPPVTFASPDDLAARAFLDGLVEGRSLRIDDPVQLLYDEGFAACTPERSTSFVRFLPDLERSESFLSRLIVASAT